MFGSLWKIKITQFGYNSDALSEIKKLRTYFSFLMLIAFTFPTFGKNKIMQIVFRLEKYKERNTSFSIAHISALLVLPECH